MKAPTFKFSPGDLLFATDKPTALGRVISTGSNEDGPFYLMFWLDAETPAQKQFRPIEARVIETFYTKKKG